MNRVKPKIFLYASEIAAFIGQNKWDYLTPFERLWKKCDKLSYQSLIDEKISHIQSLNNVVEELSNSKSTLVSQLDSGLITKRQFTLRVNKLEKSIEEKRNEIEHIETRVDDIDLSQQQKLEKYLGSDIIKQINDKNIETHDKRKATDEIIENLEIKDEKRLETIKQNAESFINKTHGTLKEDDAIEIYEKKYKVKLDVSQQFQKKYLEHISKNSEFDWYICGKVDGLYLDENKSENNYIVEVKNRTKGFFNSLRDYEKTQIQLYIWMLNVPISKLVEKHENKIRVTQVYKDKVWIDNILEYLEIFINAFEYKFLNNQELKHEYILSEKEHKQKILKQLYLNPIQKHISDKINKLLEDTESMECDID